AIVPVVLYHLVEEPFIRRGNRFASKVRHGRRRRSNLATATGGFMKILLFGATGNVGRCIVKEALNRGHQVIGVVRDPQAVPSPDPRVTLRQGDATERRSVAALASEADAVVSAISPRPNARGLAAPTLVAAARAMIAGLREAGTKQII